MTWFDGNPAHLWLYPPTEEGKRYVECIGGIDALCDKAEQFIIRGDCRFAATLLAHAVAAYPDDHDPKAKALLISAYEQLGFGAENATWRNFYLTGAQQLRTGKDSGMVAGGKTQLGTQLSVEQWFEILSIQLDGERAAEVPLTIDFDIVDVNEKWRLIVSNGVLTRRLLRSRVQSEGMQEEPQLSMVLTRTQLLEALRGNEFEAESRTGEMGALRQLVALTSVAPGSTRGSTQL